MGIFNNEKQEDIVEEIVEEVEVEEKKIIPVKDKKRNIKMTKNNAVQMASVDTIDSFIGAGWKKVGK